jgi:hypothetical protein
MAKLTKLSGGVKLQEKLAEIAKNIEGKHDLRVGFLEDARYPDEEGTYVAQVAFWLNYGTKTSPPRPFFTNMVIAKSNGWGKKLERILKSNDYDIELSLALMGEGIGGQLIDAITNLAMPPLSQVTLMLRKMRIGNPNLVVTGATVGEAARRVAAGEDTGAASTKVGVYTGHMLNSIAYQVDDGEHVPVEVEDTE